MAKYEKTFTKRVCVENARSVKGTGKREGDGWHDPGGYEESWWQRKKGIGRLKKKRGQWCAE